MKSKSKRIIGSFSIKLKVFAYFAAFTAIMLVMLWLLQTVFLQQIYQSIKISSVKECAQSAQANMSESHIKGLSSRFDVCIRIIDSNLNDEVNSHNNTNCILHRLTSPFLAQML